MNEQSAWQERPTVEGWFWFYGTISPDADPALAALFVPWDYVRGKINHLDVWSIPAERRHIQGRWRLIVPPLPPMEWK